MRVYRLAGKPRRPRSTEGGRGRASAFAGNRAFSLVDKPLDSATAND